MHRKLLLPLAATVLLAGCVTAPYQYRGNGDGGYYYGAPSVEYRYRGVEPGYYGYPYYYGPYRSGISIWGRYGDPYYYGYPRYPYYGYPRSPYYNGHPHRRPVPRPGTQANPRPDGGPWRNIDELRRRRGVDGGGPSQGPQPGPGEPSSIAPPPRPGSSRGGDGSRLGDLIRRSRPPATRED